MPQDRLSIIPFTTQVIGLIESENRVTELFEDSAPVESIPRNRRLSGQHELVFADTVQLEQDLWKEFHSLMDRLNASLGRH